MLKFENITFTHEGDDSAIIQNLNFHIQKGEFVSLIGTSGCGKSTIFRLANHLLIPDAGRILANGEDISGKRSYCGYMPQHDMLLPWRTVSDNIRLPLEIRGGFSKSDLESQVAEVLENVGLIDWAQKMPGELSGGMRQRAAFARTLLTGSDLLLLDEPFSALDYLTRLSMREWLLDQWERDHKTVLFITHDVEEAIFLSSRVLVVQEKPIKDLVSVTVPAGYPRTIKSLNQPGMSSLKEDLIGMLRTQMAEEEREPDKIRQKLPKGVALMKNEVRDSLLGGAETCKNFQGRWRS